MLNSATTNQLPGPPHFVDLHVNPGESVSIQFFDGNETILRGPTTIKMISQHAYPPMPMPVQVPPGHMIQQIVDENGTLRHIILSALNGANGATYSSSANYVGGPHQQQSAPNSSYCCCCYNTCSSGSTTPQNSLTSSVSSPPVQPHLSHNPIFPLSNSYARSHRRSNRNYSSPNYSSPNGKRLSNYSPSPFYNTAATVTNKVAPSRFPKSDNPKSNHFNRHSTPLHYDTSTRPYDPPSETKYYLNKTYDYSCNSSNASQASTVDQINDNLKYYKEDNFCIEDDFAKKPFDANHANSTKEPSYYLDFNHQPNLTSDQDSHKSSQSECTDTNQETSRLCDNFDVNYNKLNNSDYDVSHPTEPVINTTCELSENSKVANADPSSANKQRLISGPDHSLAGKEAGPPLSESELTPEGDSKSLASERADQAVEPNEVGQLKGSKRPCDDSKADHAKPMANGKLEPCRVTGAPVYVISADPSDSEKSDSDQYPEEESGRTGPQPMSVTPQRSPRHLLPKQEVINLTCTSLSANSIRLKWFFNQPSEHSEHKKHFVVDMIHGNAVEDSPNSRIVYQGHTSNCRVAHLQPQKEYAFRVRTSTESAMLVSNLLSVVTAEQQTPIGATRATGRRGKQQLVPPQLLAPHPAQTILQHHVDAETVCPVDSATLLPSLSSDQRYAILILSCFTCVALFVAVLIQHLLSVD